MLVDSKRILVIGESMLDKYIVGEVRRISPEAPVPVLKIERERDVAGGAANVASNLAAASQEAVLLSMVGNDDAGKALKSILKAMGINTKMLIETERPTITKTRYIAKNNQQVLRVDEEDCNNISESEADAALKMLRDVINSFQMIIISDYLKGFLTPYFLKEIINLAKKANVPIFIDAKDPNYDKYRGATLIKPNLIELQKMTGMPVKDSQEIKEASIYLLNECSTDYVLTTMGAKGMLLVDKKGNVEHVETAAKEVFDVSGAGDTSIAYLATFVANGKSVSEAMKYANLAAGLQVSKAGTSSVHLHEVQEAAYDFKSESSLSGKIIDSNTLESIRKSCSDLSIVFTNGCFDIIHIGHIKYLKEAASLGDVLVIGVNSDSSVSRLKGDARPVNNESDRASLLAAFDFVDYVVVFDDDTPYEVIKVLQPDVLVKGGDYSVDDIVGKDVVENRGGRVLTVPYIEGISTSTIIDKINDAGSN